MLACRGETWVEPRNLSTVLPAGVTQIVAALGGALQLSSTNRYHPNRMIWNGVGAQGKTTNRAIAWFSDDGGKSFEFAKDAATGSIFLPVGIGEESALAETPDGGIFLSSRNFLYHGRGKCDCSVRFASGGDTFGGVFPSLELVEPECEASMLGPVGDSAAVMFHANPGHGTDTENKSPPNGRASGTVRRSVDGGKTWEASLVLNGAGAYSYSCLSQVPQVGFIGLAWETVLPGTNNHYLRKGASANNVLFSLIPRNFSSSNATVTRGGHDDGPTRRLALKSDEDVEKYGAKADGRTFSGDAFNQAIAACSAAGGGVVHARGGVYMTGNIQMRSNVILDIGGNSSIIGSANASHWTRKQSDLVFPAECDGPNLMLTPCVPPGSSENFTCSFPRVLSPGPRGGLFCE